MSKTFWGILIAIIVVLGGIFWATSGHKSGNPGGSSSQPTNHVEGLGKDGITLIEYGDYECPFCGQFFPTVKEVQQLYNSQIYFQFRNLPLTQLHPNAFAGARAAEAAGLMGKFWQMHDLLYENQDPNGKSGWVASSDPLDQYFVGFAQQLGLNTTQFKKNFASDQVNNLINADQAAFNKTGQQEATPSFFLDGKFVQPSNTVAGFEQVINAEITKKGFQPPAGTTSTGTSSAPGGQSVQKSK